MGENSSFYGGNPTPTQNVELQALVTQADADAASASASAASASATLANALTKANNLSDVANATTARGNLTAAQSGANSDITSLSALSTPLSVAQGGSGRATLAAHGVVVGNGTTGVNVTGAGTSGQVLTSNGASADPTFQTLVPQGHLGGCTLSTAGSSATFSVTAGMAADSTATSLMSLAAISKTTSAWAVGSTNGALDTGAIANSTWYHVYVIKRTDTGVVDVLVSLSATAPTLPTNYTLFRRIGSMKTNGSAQWTSFVQNGDEFYWVTPVVDVNTSTLVGSAGPRTLLTLTVPSGIKVDALFMASMNNPAATNFVYFSSPDQTDSAAAAGFISLTCVVNSAPGAGEFCIRTNTSAQIGARGSAGSANTTLVLGTMGWLDNRGRG